MSKLKNKDYKFNDKAINNGLVFLFLAGCLLVALVGGYMLMITYSSNKAKNKEISSSNMQISTKTKSIAEDGKGYAEIVK